MYIEKSKRNKEKWREEGVWQLKGEVRVCRFHRWMEESNWGIRRRRWDGGKDMGDKDKEGSEGGNYVQGLGKVSFRDKVLGGRLTPNHRGLMLI